ncbi:sugar ABC transporter permease [Cellulomonas sp. DKR-3]|uniref:Sugar ABC transporter permease n=1 Tax=Cellulomonas fulva TaxID=2835530 RepID=A0ABS5TUZ5_9CELL|nr:sugar ABC transporter permease [Cellulomonas fulva]MBT0992981.1 sugar ABC transporter permease [Cellulomonas fulva]
MTLLGTAAQPAQPTDPAAEPPRRRTGSASRRSQRLAGWTFTAPAVAAIVVFVVIPVAMALWVSLLRWNGLSSPFGGGAEFVGLDNYKRLLTTDGLLRENFTIGLRNNLYYVLMVVPGTIVLAFALALMVNQQRLKGRGFFRTVFYFPSITSAVAITVTFLFLFQNSGAINQVLAWFGIDGPKWFVDSRGLFQTIGQAIGVVPESGSPTWGTGTILGLPVNQWLAGPSPALIALATMTVWASSGTFMLFFLAGLQNIPGEVDEAAFIDGASTWQRFRYVTVPLMKKSLALVAMLTVIGSWQVFDSVYLATQGGPQKTTLTPAFQSYQVSFKDGDFGGGAAIAFVLFLIIIVFTVGQRVISREKD